MENYTTSQRPQLLPPKQNNTSLGPNLVELFAALVTWGLAYWEQALGWSENKLGLCRLVPVQCAQGRISFTHWMLGAWMVSCRKLQIIKLINNNNNNNNNNKFLPNFIVSCWTAVCHYFLNLHEWMNELEQQQQQKLFIWLSIPIIATLEILSFNFDRWS